jgi:DNA recombination protein RmuC
VIIDSKVPEFDAAIADAAAANRKDMVKAHAAKLWNTVKALADKDYPAAQRKAGRTPFEHVILFVPAESLLSTALEGDPDLIVDAAKQRILLATPATLISFLGAINMTWQQHAQAEKVREIADTASELHKRVCDFVENLAEARKHVNQAVLSLNTSLGSFEKFVRPMENRLRKLGISSAKELPGDEQLAQIPEMRDLRRKGD